MTINGHKLNRAARRRNDAERKSMARDNLRHGAQATIILARYGQSVGIVDEEQSFDYLFATSAMVIATIAHQQNKKPSDVLFEFCDYVKRLDPEDPSVVDH